MPGYHLAADTKRPYAEEKSIVAAVVVRYVDLDCRGRFHRPPRILLPNKLLLKSSVLKKLRLVIQN